MSAPTRHQITALASTIAARATALTEGRFPHPEVAEAAIAHDRGVLRRWREAS